MTKLRNFVNLKLIEMKLPKKQFFIYCLLFILGLLIAFNFFGYRYLQSQKEKLRSSSQKTIASDIKQDDYLISPENPEEEYKITLYGKIVKVEENIITLENENSVRVEIAENARFYRADPEKGLEQVSKEDFKPGETTLAGSLSSSNVANYKAEIFSLTDMPTLLWREE